MGELVSPCVRIVTVGMRGAERMTLFGRSPRHKRVEHLGMRLRIGPILRDAGPLRAQALLIGVGILDNESLHPIRMLQNHAQTDWPAVVMKEEDAFVDLELIEEIVGRLGKMVESIRIGRWQRGITLTEARKVRCDQMIAWCKQWDERIELARGGRKAMQ